MMSEGRHETPPDQPLSPILLPDELAEFLREHGPFACLMHETDRGTAFLIKAPGAELRRLHGPVPIGVRHELYYQPSSPVIRITLVIYDDPENPLLLETFINVADESQRRDFAALAAQDELLLLFYDEDLALHLGKRVPHATHEAIPEVLHRADAFLTTIVPDRVNFDQAKADVMANTTL